MPWPCLHVAGFALEVKPTSIRAACSTTVVFGDTPLKVYSAWESLGVPPSRGSSSAIILRAVLNHSSSVHS
eukprot:2234130-Amphidinium_carterae.1